jgi:long-subunit acyl-CoA synthetase (AMP-forming)
MSSTMAKRTKLFLTAYIYFAPFKPCNVYITHAHVLDYRNDIRRHTMRLRTRQDPHKCQSIRDVICQSQFGGSNHEKRPVLCICIPVLAQPAHGFILSKVRAATGGRLRIALIGSAAIKRDTQEFLTTALVTVIQGSFTCV